MTMYETAVTPTGRMSVLESRRGDYGMSFGEAAAVAGAQELAELQRGFSVAHAGGPGPQEFMKNLLERMTRLRDVFKDNPYISVTGFAVNVGVPPSVSVNVEFK